MQSQFDFVSVSKKPNIHFGGRSISYVIKLENGQTKTLGVILATEEPLTFEAHVAEEIEIISGSCCVSIDHQEQQTYNTGDSFHVPANSQFKIITDDVLDYVCHFHDDA